MIIFFIFVSSTPERTLQNEIYDTKSRLTHIYNNSINPLENYKNVLISSNEEKSQFKNGAIFYLQAWIDFGWNTCCLLLKICDNVHNFKTLEIVRKKEHIASFNTLYEFPCFDFTDNLNSYYLDECDDFRFFYCCLCKIIGINSEIRCKTGKISREMADIYFQINSLRKKMTDDTILMYDLVLSLKYKSKYENLFT